MAALLSALEQTHTQHTQQPNDEQLRNVFLQAALTYLLGKSGCLFHLHAPMVPEFLELFALPNKVMPQWEQLRSLMEEPLSSCIDCITVYQESKLRFVQRYLQVYGTSAVDLLLRSLLEWDAERHVRSLTSFCQEMDQLQQSIQEPVELSKKMKSVRQRALFILYEILKYPSTLKDARVSELFTSFLMATQQKSSLKLVDQILPGVVLLAFHSSKQVASWARETLRKCNSQIELETMAELEHILVDLYEYWTADKNTSVVDESLGLMGPYQFSATSLRESIKGLGYLIPLMTTGAIDQGLFVLMPKLMDFLDARLSSSGDNCEDVLNPALTLIYFLSKKGSCIFDQLSQDRILSLCSNIAKHPSLHRALSEQVSGQDETQTSISLYWLRTFVSRRTDMIQTIFSDCLPPAVRYIQSKWSAKAKEYLYQKIIAPNDKSVFNILYSPQSSQKAKDVINCLLISCYNTVKTVLSLESMEAWINQMRDCLRQSAGNLYIYFQHVHSSDEPAAESTLYFYPLLWDALLQAGSNGPIDLFNNDIIFAYRRVALVEELHGNTTQFIVFNRVLSSLRSVMGQCLSHIRMKGLVEVRKMLDSSLPDIVFWLICPESNVKQNAESLAMLLAESTASSEFKSISYLLCLASQLESKFWNAFLDLIEEFNRHCSLKQQPNMLPFVEELIKMIGNIFCILFDDEERPTDKFGGVLDLPALWSATWVFVNHVLESSANWAKKSPACRSMVRQLLPQVFALTSFLLDVPIPDIPAFSRVCRLQIETKSPLAQPFFTALVATFPWFAALDAQLRLESVDLACRMLRYCSRTAKWSIPDEILAQVSGFVAGQIDCQLTKQERDRLSMWDKDEIEEEKEEVALVSIPKEEKLDVKQKSTYDITPTPILPWFVRAREKQSYQTAKSKGKKLSKGIKSSVMRQLRGEVMDVSTFKTNSFRPEPSNSKVKVEIIETPSTLADFHDSLTPEKPKRTMQVIDLPNSTKSATEKRLEAARVAVSKPKPLGDISNLHKQILSWEFPPEDKQMFPPYFDADSLKSIPEAFATSAEYSSVFEPLLVVECWEQFCHAKEEIKEDETVFCRMDNCLAVDGFYDLSLTAATAEIKSCQLADYDIIQLTEVNVTDKCTPSGVSPILAKINTMYTRKDVCSLVVRIYPSNRRPDIVPRLRPQSGWSIMKIFSLVTAQREYVAMLNMPLIPLANEIMNPKKSTGLRLKQDPVAIKDIMRKFQVNEPQACAVNTAITQKTGFVLIQGPPGTGKTKTILTMIGCLISQSTAGTKIAAPGARLNVGNPRVGKASTSNASVERRRILCCAPSNAACDEIIKRLRMGILDASGKKKFIPSVVRLGSIYAAHPDVKDVTLEILVEEKFMEAKEFQQFLRTTTASTENEKAMRTELDALTKQRDELKAQMVKADSTSDVTTVNDKLRQVNDKRKDILKTLYEAKEKKADNAKVLDNVKLMVRKKVLEEADVVCCTLSSAGNDILVNSKLEFPTVVIDEACQSIELSSLIPLKYNAKKCILVGDPNQLPPTVLSQLGKEFAYEQSLFQRIMKTVPDKVNLLGIQYRMHPEISRFPSKLFYNSKLLDGEGLELKKKAKWHEDPLLSPYRFFDVAGREQSKGNGKSVFNLAEVDACVSIIRRLCSHFKDMNFSNRIGVITPYKAQYRKLKDKLKALGGENIVKTIDINTVDGFQGQEKDIIILSCVRGGVNRGIGFLGDIRRMNVAFTRARNSLFVIGNATALRTNSQWSEFVQDAEDRNLMTTFDATSFPSSSAPLPKNIFGELESLDTKERRPSLSTDLIQKTKTRKIE